MNADGVFVYHGSASGLSATANWTAEGGAGASAGDVNGDGYSDVILSKPEEGGRTCVYHGSASGLSPTANWTAERNGFSVASAGDVNGDGYSDVVFGAFHGNFISTGDIRARAYYGSASGLSSTPAWTAESNQDGEHGFGCSVASAGDVNGDGYSDVIVGAESYSTTPHWVEGAAFVYHGSASGLSPTANWTADGSDVIVGAWGYAAYAGAAFVYHGAPAPPRASVRIPWTLYE